MFYVCTTEREKNYSWNVEKKAPTKSNKSKRIVCILSPVLCILPLCGAISRPCIKFECLFCVVLAFIQKTTVCLLIHVWLRVNFCFDECRLPFWKQTIAKRKPPTTTATKQISELVKYRYLPCFIWPDIKIALNIWRAEDHIWRASAIAVIAVSFCFSFLFLFNSVILLW